ncbi:MAG: hypothetical protein ACE5FW_02015 [Candidatus Aenigmatarchaeota archaeon]
MKGFAITPLLFIGVFLIVGLMLLNFTDTDARIASGISQETRLAGLEEAFQENKTTAATLLFNLSIDAVASGYTESGLLAAWLGDVLGGNATISCAPKSYKVQLASSFQKSNLDSEINRSYTVARNMTCSTIRDLAGVCPVLDCGLYCPTVLWCLRKTGPEDLLVDPSYIDPELVTQALIQGGHFPFTAQGPTGRQCPGEQKTMYEWDVPGSVTEAWMESQFGPGIVCI